MLCLLFPWSLYLHSHLAASGLPFHLNILQVPLPQAYILEQLMLVTSVGSNTIGCFSNMVNDQHTSGVARAWVRVFWSRLSLFTSKFSFVFKNPKCVRDLVLINLLPQIFCSVGHFLTCFQSTHSLMLTTNESPSVCDSPWLACTVSVRYV